MNDDEETYELSEKGVAYAKAALSLFEAGKSHEEIADVLGMNEFSDDGGKTAVQVLMAIADIQGVLD